MSASIERTLDTIAQTIFTDDFLDTLLAEDRRNLAGRDSPIYEQRYEEAKAALPFRLDRQQAADLAAMEVLRRASLRALGSFSALNGLYTGFRMVLTGEPDWSPWSCSAAHDALEDPQLCPLFQKNLWAAEALFRRMIASLTEEERGWLLDISTAWSDREYGVALQGFRLGLHGADKLLEVLSPEEISSAQRAALHRAAEELDTL